MTQSEKIEEKSERHGATGNTEEGYRKMERHIGWLHEWMNSFGIDDKYWMNHRTEVRDRRSEVIVEIKAISNFFWY